MECPKCGDWNLYQDCDGNYRCTNCGYFESINKKRREQIYEQYGLEDPLSSLYEDEEYEEENNNVAK